jgi:hypothetical protein
MLKSANASGVLGRACVGVAEASMQLLVSPEILRWRRALTAVIALNDKCRGLHKHLVLSRNL